MTKPTSDDPAAADPTRHVLKGPGDPLEAADEPTDPDQDPGSAASHGVMTIYGVDTMGSGDPTDLFDGGAVKDHLSSRGEASEGE